MGSAGGAVGDFHEEWAAFAEVPYGVAAGVCVEVVCGVEGVLMEVEGDVEGEADATVG